jgi:hypothetical protein
VIHVIVAAILAVAWLAVWIFITPFPPTDYDRERKE